MASLLPEAATFKNLTDEQLPGHGFLAAALADLSAATAVLPPWRRPVTAAREQAPTALR